MTVKEIAASAGMSVRELARRFGIPYRTMQNWSLGIRKCPEYITGMMIEILGLEDKEMTDLEILMKDGCTRSDAERHLKNGTIVFRSIDEYIANERDNGLLEDLLEDYDGSEDAFREALKDGAVPDTGYVEGSVIMYSL